MIQDITSQEQFDNLVLDKSAGLIVVDFRADRCGPCKMLDPLLDELVASHDWKFVLAKVNTDDNQDILMEYNILSIPTILIFKSGQLVEDALVGVLPLELYQEIIDKHS